MLARRDFEILIRHLQKHRGGVALPCPICGGTKWFADGPAQPLGVEEGTDGGTPTLSTTGIPMALLICETCFFVHYFALMPMRAGQTGG